MATIAIIVSVFSVPIAGSSYWQSWRTQKRVEEDRNRPLRLSLNDSILDGPAPETSSFLFLLQMVIENPSSVPRTVYRIGFDSSWGMVTELEVEQNERRGYTFYYAPGSGNRVDVPGGKVLDWPQAVPVGAPLTAWVGLEFVPTQGLIGRNLRVPLTVYAYEHPVAGDEPDADEADASALIEVPLG